LRSGAGGGIAAHAAALRAGHECGREQHHRHEANAVKADLSEAGAHVRAY
jgi:ribosomal protein L7/L12